MTELPSNNSMQIALLPSWDVIMAHDSEVAEQQQTIDIPSPPTWLELLLKQTQRARDDLNLLSHPNEDQMAVVFAPNAQLRTDYEQIAINIEYLHNYLQLNQSASHDISVKRYWELANRSCSLSINIWMAIHDQIEIMERRLRRLSKRIFE
jgi:hypothetical protein